MPWKASQNSATQQKWRDRVAEPQDFRKSIDGLAGVVASHLERDPLDGDVYVFHNRPRTALKVLYSDYGGFCLAYKRLKRGRFRVPSLHTTRREVSLSPATRPMPTGIPTRSTRTPLRPPIPTRPESAQLPGPPSILGAGVPGGGGFHRLRLVGMACCAR